MTTKTFRLIDLLGTMANTRYIHLINGEGQLVFDGYVKDLLEMIEEIADYSGTDLGSDIVEYIGCGFDSLENKTFISIHVDDYDIG